MTGQVGEAFIEVHADSSGLSTEVKVAAKKASESAEVTVKTKVDSRSLEQAVQRGVSRRSIRSLAELNFSLAKVAAGATLAIGTFTDYSAIVQGAVAATVALGSALGESAVAAGSAAGVAAALGAAYGTYKIAALGVEDALKAVTKTQDEIAATGKASEATLEAQAAAMKNLAPSAREFVRAVGGARGEFDTFRRGIQDVAFAGLGDTLSTLATTALPQLQNEFEGIAGTLNEAAIATGDWLSESENITRIEGIMSSLDDILQDLIPGIGAVASGMLNLFEGILPSSDRLANSLTDIGQSFETWTEGVVASGELAETMDHAQDTAGELVSILGNVGDALLTVFEAGTGTGQDLLGTIDEATESLATFLESAEGQAGLANFFETTSTAADALATAFDVLGPAAQGIFEAFRILGPAMDDLHEAVAPVAEVVSEELAAALTGLATAAAPVISAFADLVGALPPELVGTVVALAVGFKLLGTAGATVAPGITKAKAALSGMETGLAKANVAAGALKGGLAAAAGGAGLILMTKGAEKGSDAMTTLGGALSGAAAGFAVGGPLGAGIGGTIGLLSGLITATSDAEDAIKSLDEAMKASGGEESAATFEAAASATDAYSDALKTAGISEADFQAALAGDVAKREELMGIINEQLSQQGRVTGGRGASTAAIGGETIALGELGRALESSEDSQKAGADAAELHAEAMLHDKEAIEANSDAARAAIDAHIGFRDSIREANKAAREHEGQAKKNSAAYDVLLGKAKGVGDQFDRLPAKAQNTTRAMETAAGAVETLGDDMGLSDKKTEDLIRQLGLVPDTVDIRFKEDGSIQVIDHAKQIKQAADAVSGTFTTIFSTIFKTTGSRPTGPSGGRSVDAQGGIHTSPTTVRVGDRAPELVVPLDPKAQLRPGVEDALLALASARGGDARAPVNLNITAPTDDPVALGFRVLDRLAVAGVL